MKYFKVTLNQFCDFAMKTGTVRYTAAHNIFIKITNDFNTKQDYWLQLRKRIQKALRTTGMSDALDRLENDVNESKRDNYRIMVIALKKFLGGKKKFERVDLPLKIWSSGSVKIKVSPQLCYSYRNKVHVVHLYLRINDSDKLDKRRADMILQIMHDAIGLDGDVSIELLDVARDHVFKYQDKNREKLSFINKAEAHELGEFLEQFDQNREIK